MIEEFLGTHLRLLYTSGELPEPEDLDEAELAHTQKRKIESDRHESAVAIHLAHRLGVARVRHDEKGRPLGGAVDLSLSHKDGVVAAACVKGFRVGVDVENAAALKNPERFGRRALAPNEKTQLEDFRRAWSASEREVMVVLWSLKECFYKATGFDPGPSHTEFAIHAGSLRAEVVAGGQTHKIVESLVRLNNGRILTALVF